MNELKYQITQIVFLILLGAGTYWAFTHLDTGIRYERDQLVTIDQIQDNIPDQSISIISNENIPETNSDQTIPNTDDVPEVTAPTVDIGNADLISELNQIADSGSIIQSGASGDRVGIIQEFLSVYFADRNITIDSDYGPTTTSLVREFQTTEIGGGDGRVGPNTLGSMIDWLENN